jgi:HNH endonuclease
MRKLKNRHCNNCGAEYTPTGSCSKYCPTCKPVVTKEVQKEAIKRWAINKGILNGKGSGSSTGTEKANHMYSHGRCVFRRWAKERKLQEGLCEHCGKDIKDATHYEWVGHHKDHNPNNNVIENLILLCKQCHQIEHECHKAFEGVTTIPEGSRADNSSKRLAPEMGDDIV